MNLPNMLDAKVRGKSKVQYLENESFVSKEFQGKKYFIRTYGCQMNVHDSEEIVAVVENLGFTGTSVMEEADLVVLNTCAIRENAHDKVFGYLGRLKHLKREKPELLVAIGGCMPQQSSVVDEILKKHPYVDIVFGTHNINELGRMILESKHKQEIQVYSIEGNVYENVLYHRDSKITAWVNIMYGCDKFCTYCIVPFTRGKQRSRKMSQILNEVRDLKSQGYQEITLLGQNVNAYGKDLEEEISFATLLKEVSKIGIPRVRFVTSHPWDFTDEMIDVIAKCDNVMPYIHLPLQSGSSRILKLMGRRYTKSEYLELYRKMKEQIPGVAITTDIIVGFPGETEEDFQDTLDVVKSCEYDGAFTFIFSPREGTPASKMKDDTPSGVKEERLHRLNEMVNSYSNQKNQEYVGKVVSVLIQGVSEKDPNKVYGYTETMKLVNVVAAKDSIGKIIPVLITEAKSFSLDGEMKELVAI
ncbi:MAG: tRNA (N6-isopentenyl adenosine(37)-C2)-methylthiotransferase MiaB [Bacilli bacterium]|nr:tRNA (N6-isopentenyl adenosine(37)-C2)-methylthiotransferase MiaB [Bacilli bacterium]